MSVVNYQVENGIGIIRVNNPPVNALSQALRIGVQDAIKTAQSDDSKAIVIFCEGRSFIDGALITEFGKPPMSLRLPEVVEEIGQETKHIIVAAHRP